MIIGNGMISTSLKKIDNKNILFFASGVSDSTCRDEIKFNRERILLKESINDKKLIYFSSIPEYISNEKYLNHKKNIENIIQNNYKNYIIIRIPQIYDKGGNKKNFINFIYNNIKNNIEFDMYNTYRSIIKIDDLIKILDYLIKIDYNGCFDINYIELMNVSCYVNIIEKILKKKAQIKNIIDIDIDIKENNIFVEEVIREVGIIKKDYNYNGFLSSL